MGDALKSLNCPRCQEKNTAVSKFCSRCGSALSIQIAMSVEELRDNGDTVINELVKDTEIQSIILKKMMTDEQFKKKIKAIV